jgi:hypothetical protein
VVGLPERQLRAPGADADGFGHVKFKNTRFRYSGQRTADASL